MATKYTIKLHFEVSNHGIKKERHKRSFVLS